MAWHGGMIFPQNFSQLSERVTTPEYRMKETFDSGPYELCAPRHRIVTKFYWAYCNRRSPFGTNGVLHGVG